MTVDHVRRIRADPRYNNALFVVFIEANMSWISADGLWKKMLSFIPITVERADSSGQGRPGVITTDESKEVYARLLTLQLQERRLFLAEDIISAHNAPTGSPSDVAKLLKTLEDQLSNFRKVKSVPKESAFGKVKETITGKSHGRKDDLVMALGILLYWAQKKIMIDVDFQRMCREKRLTM